MSARQLLPPFYIYSAAASTKEPQEDFSWHGDRTEFENVRQALDKVEGSREWLKNYVGSFCDDEANKLICHMDTSYHSGASLSCLLRMYQFLLGDWDGWVLAQKTRVLQDEYNAKQISWGEVNKVLCSKNTSDFKLKYNLDMSDEELLIQLSVINKEFNDLCVAEKKMCEDKYNADRINVLEHHFEHPSRWFDSPYGSSLAGHPSKIEPKHLAEMEKRHPGYQEQMMIIIKQLYALKN